ncbi:helix-turn-helix domain-containing protein [Flavilitoribacter nigricans]|uniref:AraC family transcriptional regulator n=1 Tax=Flavilitoribacter nigricans (strain ATCC 23147 / DSM 23189 / NBRC 102662 / NCIMB 1420 / SS-2) TaxID=1122177 RepID=A0A2D0N139_FLAN2|nr:AraC family transcriptional regulator [Flavilitoribacter nigricans]PHN02150.1 AraC family transcriptional regulator [Flavilitoribacter nigricans DSM 23189 = NBRC 102662]
MKFGFGPYSSILLVFFFHLVVSGALILKLGLEHRLRSAQWLSLVLVLVALYISPFMLGYAGWYGMDGYRETLFYLPLQQILFIGPVFLFYLKTLLYPEYSPSKRDQLHFLPGSLYLLYSLVVFIFDVFLFDQVYFYQDGRDKDFDLWYQIAGFISMITYFLLSLRLYQRYRRQIFDQLSYAEEVAYNWVRNFLLIFLLILILRALFFIINPEWGEFGRKFWYYLSISIVGYFLAIRGYRQSILLSTSLGLRNLVPEVMPPAIATTDATTREASESEALSEDHVQLVRRIEQIMHRDHLYQNSTLTLSGLAEHLQTTSKNISQAINKGTGLNFNDYVNRFRIEAFLQEIEAGTHEQHTLLGIAISCGFNSKSTFNRAFKKQLGLSPNEYVRKHRQGGAKS